MLTLQQKIKAVRLQDLLAHFSRTKFVQYEQTVTLLYKGWLNNHHVILYGRGGFGKSEMVSAFFEYIQACVEDVGFDKPTVGLLDAGKCSTSKLWGGYHPEQLPNEYYRLEHSWISYDYFIFEELFDAYLAALQTMKQTMTSKRYTSPFQDMAVRNQFLVCLTNMSPAEVLAKLDPSDQNTIQALMDRFPLQLLHEWSETALKSQQAWQELFEKNSGLDNDSNYYLSLLCSNIHRAKGWINPRMAIRIAGACQTWSAVEGTATSPYYIGVCAGDYLDPIGKQQLWLLADSLEQYKPQPPEPEPAFIAEDLDICEMIESLAELNIGDISLPYMQKLDMKVKHLCYAFEDSDPDSVERLQSMFGKRLYQWQIFTDTTFVEA